MFKFFPISGDKQDLNFNQNSSVLRVCWNQLLSSVINPMRWTLSSILSLCERIFEISLSSVNDTSFSSYPSFLAWSIASSKFLNANKSQWEWSSKI